MPKIYIRYFQMEGKMEKTLMEELKKLLSLIENYKEDILKLSKLTNRDLSSWLQ